MASHDALWAKLHELELQLAAYKLLRAARPEDVSADGGQGRALWATEATCRGRRYEAYMRRRDARHVAASAEQQPARAHQPRGTRSAGRSMPMSPRALRCTARDTQEVRRTLAAVSIPSTPRWESAGLPKSRTVKGASAAGSPARSHHQRQNSLGLPADFGDSVTPRPFLKRGTGTGGAVAAARLGTPRVHDLPSIDAPSTPRQPPRERGHAQAARHVRSVSELPFDTAALASPQTQVRARKRWGSPERPAVMLSAADSHRDFSKGLKKLLSFVRKGKGAADQPFPSPSPGGSGKPVRKGWSGVAACSLVDVPFDRASLEAHRFPITRAVGISG
ncbi:uncharacterized protein LOC133896699 [Phragmites australis]|uniref:uncharacterized protein LOC133896699 n=1 Tax=Phragmites australis TaxID=29695 RepID=UPI002D76564A|nr:uncharacterized protein LOC133896699 [Phragmites australis]